MSFFSYVAEIVTALWNSGAVFPALTLMDDHPVQFVQIRLVQSAHRRPTIKVKVHVW